MKHLLLTTIAAVVLLGCGPSEVDIALIDAAFDGNIEAVKQHLAAGTDVNAKDRMGFTPLHHAVTFGHKEIIELLIAEGADVNAKTDDGVTPLDWGILNDDTETAALLRKHGGKNGTIHSAIGSGDIEAIKKHLADGADVNAKNDGGITPLHEAALGGHKEIVELLIAKGADVNAKIKRGDTPLDTAETVYEDDSPELKAAKKETADFLRKHGGKTGEELKAEGK